MEAYNVWRPVTPSDTTDLPDGLTNALWIGSGGDVAAVMQNGQVQVFAAVPAGAWMPLTVKRINASGTTATGIIALYFV